MLIRVVAVLDDRRLAVDPDTSPATSILLDWGAAAPPDTLGINDARARAGLRVIAVGPEAETAAEGLDPARQIDLRDAALLPAMANAHTHLDLTTIGPQPYDPADGFESWIGLVMRQRPTDQEAIRAAVAEGARLCLQGGVVAVGDIAGATHGAPNPAAVQALLDSPLAGVGFLEVLGIGRSERERRRRLEDGDIAALLERGSSGPVRVGLQPHAPYSTALSVYESCRRLAERVSPRAPLATHLAETRAEREFVAQARGPQRELLERLGLLVDGDPLPEGIGRGEHPVGFLAETLHARPWLLAHLNDAPDHAIRTLLAAADDRNLRGSGTVSAEASTVAWCPRAWQYFGHEPVLGPHRWCDLHDAGVPVCLATDSVINLPADVVRTRGMSVLDEARVAAACSERVPDPSSMLAMITTTPARALGLSQDAFRFTPGHALAGVVAVPIDAHAKNGPGDAHESRGRTLHAVWSLVLQGCEPTLASPVLLAFDRNAVNAASCNSSAS
jgi:cytosine/adenosine deaminase-related metal-dependent hydrolase